jgi:cyclopropane fatty-acyl-phospholipid synthase-like methyltransferase
MHDPHAIASMPLYVNADRIDNELAELGLGDNDVLTAAQLFPFDQYHYHGTDAVHAAAHLLGLGRTSHVLEIGSGLGGPARYLASTIGCHVTALELQSELHAIATRLTARCGLGQRLTHVCGDALTYAFPPATFDAVVSWLALHHIPERPRLLAGLAHTLRRGGQFYAEDLCQRAPFAASDLHDVHHTIFGLTLTSIADYVHDLQEAGFTEIAATDLSDDWATFCSERAMAWRAHRRRHVRVHGEPTYTRLDTFYAVVLRLFGSGSLGGLRVVARVA